MTRRRFGGLVALLLVLGAVAYYWQMPGRAGGGEEFGPFTLKALPIEHAEVFRAAGVYSWRWRLGLPREADGQQAITLQYSGKDGVKRLFSVSVPTAEAAKSNSIEVFVVMHFDARTPMEAERMVASLTCGGTTARFSADNPFKCKESCQNVFSNQSEAKGGRVELMTITKDGEPVPWIVELAVRPKAN